MVYSHPTGSHCSFVSGPTNPVIGSIRRGHLSCAVCLSAPYQLWVSVLMVMSRKWLKRHALERHCWSGCLYVVEAGVHSKKEHCSWSTLPGIFGQCERIKLRPIDIEIYWIWWIFSLIIQELEREVTVLCCRSHHRGLGKSSECFWGGAQALLVQESTAGKGSEFVCWPGGHFSPLCVQLEGSRDHILWT